MRAGFSKCLRLLALCALGVVPPVASRAQDIPPPTRVAPSIALPHGYGGFKTVAPCLYDAMGPGRRAALLDALRSGGHSAYAAQMQAYNAVIPAFARQCNPLLDRQFRPTVLVLNAYLDQATALALLNEFGVTQAQLDDAVGPDTAPLFDYVHANAVAIVTPDKKDRAKPAPETQAVLAALMAGLHLPDAQKAVGREAVWSYYVGRETVSILNAQTYP